MNKKIPKVVITEIPGKLWSYYQYFLLGFYELKKQKKIVFKVKTDLLHRISCLNLPFPKYTGGVLRILARKLSKKESTLLKGYLLYEDTKRYFVIDCADSPFLFSEDDLKLVDGYFKMQCPKEIKKEGFDLNKNIKIPYVDYKSDVQGNRMVITNIVAYSEKIKPLMVGFRRLGYLNSYRCLRRGLDTYSKDINMQPKKKAMCYFGNAKGPIPLKEIQPLRYGERQICGLYDGLMQHPNEKRAKVSELINAKGDGYEGRVVSLGNSDSGYFKQKDLIIPYENFCAYISNFQYNINISGYRLSIPNRFIESFVVGTAIMTDKLSIKWYLPFDEEVFETISMGYEKDCDVDWPRFEKDLVELPMIEKKNIIEIYNRKWAPDIVTEYILNTLLK